MNGAANGAAHDAVNGAPDATTNGAENRAGSGPRRRFRFPLWIWATYAGILLIVSAVVASSFWMEAGRTGAAGPFWPFALNEASSIVIIFALTPLVFAWAGRLDPRRIGWPRMLAGHLAGLAAFGAVHIGGMTLLRVLLYPLFGGAYAIGRDRLLATLIYEGRKDALAYAGMVLGAWLLAAALRKPAIVAVPAAATAAAAPGGRIEIRDGARRIFVDPAEILWIEAAGNYVELHLPGKSLLQRQTLAAAARELAARGFVRIHRSRLVNRRHVRASETNDSGDFTVTLSDGRRIAGGRRWRGALDGQA
jgi:hypothetical protein